MSLWLRPLLLLQSLRSFLVLSRRRRCGSGACVCVATMTNELLAVVVVVSFRSEKTGQSTDHFARIFQRSPEKPKNTTQLRWP